MGWTALSCALIATFLTMLADPVISSQEYRPPDPEPVALFNGGKAVKGEALLQLHEYVKQGDSLLHDRLKESFSTLRELVKEGDGNVQDRLLEGLAQSKEQLKGRDDQLKEELDENVAWLKDQLTKGQSQLNEELAEEEARRKEQLTEQKENLEKLRSSVKQRTESNRAVIDDLKKQMTDFQEELKSTKQQTTAVQTQLQAEVHSLKVEVDSLQSSYALLKSSELGSVFTRWGHTTCPDNTSLVYSGVAGGSWFRNPGGGSNYLCLVMDPQLDNVTDPKRNTVLYGAEYAFVEGQHDQDVVCSVCRAPQTTTLMIPATRTCPPGWASQYTGYLMAQHETEHKRTEFVCVDELLQHREGGDADENGALFMQVKTHCGSLPCPPYVHGEIVTCVVCSM